MLSVRGANWHPLAGGMEMAIQTRTRWDGWDHLILSLCYLPYGDQGLVWHAATLFSRGVDFTDCWVMPPWSIFQLVYHSHHPYSAEALGNSLWTRRYPKHIPIPKSSYGWRQRRYQGPIVSHMTGTPPLSSTSRYTKDHNSFTSRRMLNTRLLRDTARWASLLPCEACIKFRLYTGNWKPKLKGPGAASVVREFTS